MDHFEQELARMMRDTQENTPFEDRYRHRLQAGVRARRRTRTVWMATGSALTIAGLGVGLMVLPSAFAQGGPTGPQHRPASATPVPAATGPLTARPAPGVTPTKPELIPNATGTLTATAAPWLTPTEPELVPEVTGTSTTK